MTKEQKKIFWLKKKLTESEKIGILKRQERKDKKHPEFVKK